MNDFVWICLGEDGIMEPPRSKKSCCSKIVLLCPPGVSSDEHMQSDAQRLRQRHLPSTSLSGRGEGGGGGATGGVLPKRLKSGSGHHRLEFVRLPMAVTR